MTIQHNLITGSDLHEPKGVAAAGANHVYVANGSGSGTWQTVASGSLHMPRGSFYFQNTASVYTLAYSATPSKIEPTTIVSGISNLVTEATTARLTYTGTPTVVLKLDFNASLKQSTGSNKEIAIMAYKNTTLIDSSLVDATFVTGNANNLSGSCIVSAATNDYFCLYALNGSGSGDMVFNKVALTLTQA